MIAILLSAPVSRLLAQDGPVRAYLLEQPRYRGSIALLPANTIANYSSTYQLGEEDLRIIVAAAEGAPLSFEPAGCVFADVEVYAESGEAALFRYSAAGYDVYVAAPRSAPWACAALERFVTDFAFFASVDRTTTEAIRRLSGALPPRIPAGTPQFPAVLEIGPF